MQKSGEPSPEPSWKAVSIWKQIFSIVSFFEQQDRSWNHHRITSDYINCLEIELSPLPSNHCYIVLFLLISILLLSNTDGEDQWYFYFKKEVNFLGLRLGIDAYACFEGSHQRTWLNSVQEAHKHFEYLVSEQQMRQWWYYFQKFGFVPVEIKYFKKKRKRVGKQKQASQWTQMHTKQLEKLIDDDPDFYLDKIQYIFCELGYGYWNTKYLLEKLTTDIEYSLQVAVNRSYMTGMKERKEFIQVLKDCLIDPYNSLILNKSQKDCSLSRRWHRWSKLSIMPPLQNKSVSFEFKKFQKARII